MIKMFSKFTLAMAVLATASCQTIAEHGTDAPAKDYQTYVQPGEQFKHTAFTDSHGQPVMLGAKRKLVILFATWCSDSQRALKELNASPLVNDETLQIVAIGRNEDNDTLNQFNEQYQLPFPLVADPKREIYSQYANAGIPRLILLNEQNQVVQTLIGEEENIISKLKW